MATNAPNKQRPRRFDRVLTESVRILEQVFIALFYITGLLLIPVLASEQLRDYGGLVILFTLLLAFSFAITRRYLI